MWNKGQLGIRFDGRNLLMTMSKWRFMKKKFLLLALFALSCVQNRFGIASGNFSAIESARKVGNCELNMKGN